MELSTVKDIAQVIAFLSTGIYFLYKLLVGQLIVNISLAANCHRFSIEGKSEDAIVVNVLLKKGDRGTVELHDAQVKATLMAYLYTRQF